MADIALIVVSAIVPFLLLACSLYILLNYQHPDDYNQSWFPKIVVVLGLTLAQLSILLLPADVANQKACLHAGVGNQCTVTLPMEQLWYSVWLASTVFVFLVIPFAMFFYEGDEDKSLGKRILYALLWCMISALVFGSILGVLYGVVGYADLSVKRLVSATVPITADFSALSSAAPCVSPYNIGLGACAAETAPLGSYAVWTLRVSFPMYAVALSTVCGSLLFAVFGGTGIATLPLSCIMSFIRRPRKTISRSEYTRAATALGKRAQELRQLAAALQGEERSGLKGWNHRVNSRKIQQELAILEEDVEELELKFPRGEQPDVLWGLTILYYIGLLVFGVVGLCVSIAWVLHIILYMCILPPISPFLNDFFTALDSAWGLLGTIAFALFCTYLLLCVIAGEMFVGLNLLVFSIHPMRWNGTLMSSFLFNVALILATQISVIQFCSKAFAIYAQATSVQQIFGHNLESLRGIKYLYRFNVFQYIFLVCFFAMIIAYLVQEHKRKKRLKRKQAQAGA